MKRQSERQFLTKRELADETGLSVYTIDQWVAQRRELPFVKMGKRVMFARKDVDAWIARRTVKPADDLGERRGH